MNAPLTNLLDLDPAQLTAYCAELGEKPFRAKQLQRWIHQFGASDFDAMTDLAKSLREKLKTRAFVQAPAVISSIASYLMWCKLTEIASTPSAFHPVFPN